LKTNEFEISLLRELKVCGNTIKRILKFLNIMERKHKKTTVLFIKEYQSGALDTEGEFKDDYTAWKSTYESLRQWQDLERQYQEQFRIIKK
jgi:hypothetical protein